ncbi:MAG: hypothetical protein ACK5IJ_11670 [Mangrovibacterium sp.]
MMNEQDFKEIIKKDIKPPSSDFTDKLMQQIYLIENRRKHRAQAMMIVAASVLVGIASLFVEIPNLQLMNYTFQTNELVLPLIALLLMLFAWHELYELKQKIEA